MTLLQLVIVIFCGLMIGLAIYLLIRSLAKMAKGQCCEGCTGCPQAENCSSRGEAKAELEQKGQSEE